MSLKHPQNAVGTFQNAFQTVFTDGLLTTASSLNAVADLALVDSGSDFGTTHENRTTGRAVIKSPSGVTLMMQGLGAGSEDETFSVVVSGVRKVAFAATGAAARRADFWAVSPLLQAQFTLGTRSAALAADDAVWADTVSVSQDGVIGPLNAQALSYGASQHPAVLAFDFVGCEYLLMDFSTGGSATSCGAVWTWI